MIQYDANLLEKDSDGNTVLHVYCDGNPEPEILKLFIEGSVNINAQNVDGNTGLHYLCEKKVKTECITYLLENGAEAKIIEELIDGGQGSTVYSVSECFLGQDARLDSVLIQGWNTGTVGHITSRVRLERDSHYRSSVVVL